MVSEITRYVINSLIHPKKTINDIHNALAFRIYFTEDIIKDQYRWLMAQIKPNTTLVDLGANIGDAAFYFAPNQNIRQIIAFEPTKRPYNESVSLRELSPYKDKIKLNNIAVTKSREKLKSAYDGETYAKTVTLGAVLKGLRNVVIKCDIEGGEETVFDIKLSKEVYAVMVEWHGESARIGLKKSLERNGFEIVNNYQTKEGFGMICAKRT